MRLITAAGLTFLCMMVLGICTVDHSSGAPPATKKESKPVGKPSFPRNRAPTVGDKGMLNAQRAKVLQVIDANNTLIELEYVTGFIRVGQSIEPDEKNELVWLVRPTGGMVDGRMFKTDQVFEVTGTKQYNTQAGLRTIPLVEVPDEQEDEKAGYRTWVSLDGSSAIVAKLREITGTKKDTKATLEKKDGTSVALPIASLCRADQKMIQGQLAGGTTKEKPVDGNEKPEKANVDEARTKWLNESYNTTVRWVKDKVWEEVDNKTGTVSHTYKETARNNDHIEIFCPKRNYDVRLLNGTMEMKKDGKWTWVANGRWADAR